MIHERLLRTSGLDGAFGLNVSIIREKIHDTYHAETVVSINAWKTLGITTTPPIPIILARRWSIPSQSYAWHIPAQYTSVVFKVTEGKTRII